MRLAGTLSGAQLLPQILSQHILVTIQNFEAFLILFFSLPIFKLTYHTRVRYMLFAFPQIISLICCSTALRKLRLLNRCDYCSRGFYLLPPHPRFSCSCRNRHVNILQRYNIFMVCYGVLPCFAVLSGVNPDEFTILYSVYVCQAVIHLLIVSVSPLSELCRHICSIFSLFPVLFYASVFKSLPCLAMYLTFTLVVSLVIRSIVQRMDAYLEVLEYTTFNHSLLRLVMSVFRALAPPEFLYRMMPSYSQQTYKHRLSTKRRKFLESYTLCTLPTIFSTTSVESVPSMYALGLSSTPNLYTQTLYTSSTSSILMEAENYSLHRRSMGSLKQYAQARNFSILTKDLQDGGASPRPPVNPAFPYPLCLLPLPFRPVSNEINHEQGMLYSVLSASVPNKTSSQSLRESKKDRINPEVLKKRNPIVKYEVNVHIHERYILLCMIHVQRPVMSILNSKTAYTLSDELNYLGLLNLLFSTLDYVLSSFFSPKLCLHKLKVDTKAYYVYVDLSSHASAMFKEQIEPVYPVDVDIINSSITKSKGACLQTILTFATMASYFASSMGLECTSTIVYTRTVMGFFGFEHHVFELVNPGLGLLNGMLSNFYEIICDAPSVSAGLQATPQVSTDIDTEEMPTAYPHQMNASAPTKVSSTTNSKIKPPILKLPSRYPSIKKQHHCTKYTRKANSTRVTRKGTTQTINTDNRIFFINQVTGYNDAFSTQDFFTDIPQDIFISELIDTDTFVNLLQSHSTVESPHHSIYELLPPCYNLLPLPYRLRCSVQGSLRRTRHDIVCENSYFFEVLPRPELVYILMKLLIYSLAYDIRTTQPHPVEEVLNTANYDSLCANNKASCFADISLSVLQDPVLLNFMSLESYRQTSITPRKKFRTQVDTDNSQSGTSPTIQEKAAPCTNDSIFLRLFPIVPEAVFLPDVLLPDSFSHPFTNTIILPSIGFLAPYTRTAMRKAVAQGLMHKMNSNYDNRNVVNSRSDNKLSLAKRNNKRGCSSLTNCCTDDNTLRMLCTSSDPSLTFNVRTTANSCANTSSGTNINSNKWLTLVDMFSESNSSFRTSKSIKSSGKRTALSMLRENKSRLSLTRFPSLTFTARNMGNFLHINPLQMLPLPKGKPRDNVADFSSHLQFFGDQSIEMQIHDSEDSSSLTQFQGTCYSTMSRHLSTFSDILKSLSNFQTLEHIYDIEFSPIDDDCLMFYGTARHFNNTSQFSGRMSAQEYYRHVLNAHTISKESIARYQEELYDGMLILFPEASDIVPREILLMNSKLLTRQLSRSVKGFLFSNRSQNLELLSNQLSDGGKSELKDTMNLAETTTVTSEEMLPIDVDIIELSDQDKVLSDCKRQHQRVSSHTGSISRTVSISTNLARSKTKNNLMRDVPHSAISSDIPISHIQSYDPMLLEKSASKATLSFSSQLFSNAYASSGHSIPKPSSEHCNNNSTAISPITDVLGQNVVIKEVHLLSSVPPSDSALLDLCCSSDDKSPGTLEPVEDSAANESSSFLLETLTTRTSEDTRLSTVRGNVNDFITEQCPQYSQSIDHVRLNVSTPSLVVQPFNHLSDSSLSSSGDSLSVSSSILSSQDKDIIRASGASKDSLDNIAFNLISSPLDCPGLTNTTCCRTTCSNEGFIGSTYETNNTTSQVLNSVHSVQRASIVLSTTYQKAEECIATHITSTPCSHDITHSITSSICYSCSSSDEDSADRRYTKSLESDDDIKNVVGIMNLSLVDDIILRPTSIYDSDTHTQMDFQMNRNCSVRDLHESSGNSPFQNIKLFTKKSCTDTQNSMKIAQLSRENSLETRTLIITPDQPDRQYHMTLTDYIVDSRSPTSFVDISRIPDEGVAAYEVSPGRTKLRFLASSMIKVLLAWYLRAKRSLKAICLGLWLKKQVNIFEETGSYISDKKNNSARTGLFNADINTSKQVTRHVFDSIPYLNHLFETLQSTAMLLPVFSFILYKGTKKCTFLFRLMGPNFSMPSVLFQANVLLFIIQLLVLRGNAQDSNIFCLAHNHASTLAPISASVLKQALYVPLKSIMAMFLKLVIRVVELFNFKLQWAPLHRMCISIRATAENIMSSVALSWNSERTYLWVLIQFITGKGMSISALRLIYVLVFLPTVYLIFLYYDKHAEKCQAQHRIVPLELFLYALLIFINAYYIELLLNFQIIQITRLLETIKICRSELESIRGNYQLAVYTALQAAYLESSLHMRGVLTKTILDFFLALLGVVTYWFILSSVVAIPPLLLSINSIVIFTCSLFMKFSVFKVAPYVLILQVLLCFFILRYIKPFLISYILIMKAKVSILLNWYQSQRIFQFVISDHMFALLIKSLRMHENLSILKNRDGEINTEMAKNMGLQYCTLPDDSAENGIGSMSAICKRYKRLSINNCGFIAQTHTSIRGSVTDMTMFLFDNSISSRILSHRYLLYQMGDFIWDAFNKKILQPAKLYAYGIGLLSELRDPLQEHTTFGLPCTKEGDVSQLVNESFSQQLSDNKHKTRSIVGTGTHICEELSHWKVRPVDYFYDSTLRVSLRSTNHSSPRYTSSQATHLSMTLKDLSRYWKHKQKDAHQLHNELKDAFAAADEFVRGYTSYNDSRTLGMRRYAEVSPNSMCMVISFSDLFFIEASAKGSKSTSYPEETSSLTLPFRTQTNDAFYCSSIQFQIIREFIEILYLYLARFGRHIVVTSASFYRIEMYTKCNVASCTDEMVNNILSYISNTQLNLLSLFRSARTMFPMAMRTLNSKYLKKIYGKEKPFISNSSLSSVNAPLGGHHHAFDFNHKVFSESMTVSVEESTAGLLSDETGVSDLTSTNVKYTKEDLCIAICLCDMLALGEYMRDYFVKRVRRVLPKACISIGIAHGLCIETILGNYGHPFCIHGAAVSKARYIAECVQVNSIGISDAADRIHTKLKAVLDRLINYDSCNPDKMKERFAGKSPTLANTMSAHNLVAAYSRTFMKESYGYSVGE